MSQTERLYRRKHLLDSGRCMGKVELLEGELAFGESVGAAHGVSLQVLGVLR